MAKIQLTRNEAIEVSKETAERVDQEWKEGKKKIIDIDGRSIKRGRIAKVLIENKSGTRSEAYDLSKDEDRQIIKDFEKELNEAKAEELPESQEYYGRPLTDSKFLPHDWVENPALGYIHPGIVQYCLKNVIITRKEVGKQVQWSIADPVNYKDWDNKWQGYRELLVRREFAKKGEEEAMDKIEEIEEAKKEVDIVKQIPF